MLTITIIITALIFGAVMLYARSKKKQIRLDATFAFIENYEFSKETLETVSSMAVYDRLPQTAEIIKGVFRTALAEQDSCFGLPGEFSQRVLQAFATTDEYAAFTDRVFGFDLQERLRPIRLFSYER